MKKAKIMLASIAVIAVVGGALAFKAKSTQNIFYFDPIGSTCTLTLPGFTTTSDQSKPLGYIATTTTLDCSYLHYTAGQ